MSPGESRSVSGRSVSGVEGPFAAFLGIFLVVPIPATIMADSRTEGPIKCPWTPTSDAASPHTKDPRYARKSAFSLDFQTASFLELF